MSPNELTKREQIAAMMLQGALAGKSKYGALAVTMAYVVQLADKLMLELDKV